MSPLLLSPLIKANIRNQLRSRTTPGSLSSYQGWRSFRQTLETDEGVTFTSSRLRPTSVYAARVFNDSSPCRSMSSLRTEEQATPAGRG